MRKLLDKLLHRKFPHHSSKKIGVNGKRVWYWAVDRRNNLFLFGRLVPQLDDELSAETSYPSLVKALQRAEQRLGNDYLIEGVELSCRYVRPLWDASPLVLAKLEKAELDSSSARIIVAGFFEGHRDLIIKQTLSHQELWRVSYVRRPYESPHQHAV